MGVRSLSDESTVYSDKDVDGHKPSSSCLPSALSQWWKSLPQRLDHQRIERLRKAIDRDRKDVLESMNRWELHRTTWRRRAEAWMEGEDISVEERKAGRFSYDTAYRYSVTVVGPVSGTQNMILDFRTPEGREAALEWYESRYEACNRNGRRFLGYYDSWVKEYQDYQELYILNKGQGWADQPSLPRTVLRGVPKVYWAVATSKKLPN
ncbi:hypothetical protein VMCG_01058 [Cytospora schulzeri]|uniref:Uncharacterized protein n=1 Tax=Cytospora schulzeri TaxID=448051 RepID=A0A423X5A3_9PEZI|nr:hypothetical protein VMCG_01058 [Valsa malicola]